MRTERVQFTMRVDPPLVDFIEDYQRQFAIKCRSVAIRKLLETGLVVAGVIKDREGQATLPLFTGAQALVHAGKCYGWVGEL